MSQAAGSSPSSFHTIPWRATDLAIVLGLLAAMRVASSFSNARGAALWLLLALQAALYLALIVSVLWLARRRAGALPPLPGLRRIAIEVGLAVPLLALTWFWLGLALAGFDHLTGVPVTPGSPGPALARAADTFMAPMFAVLAVGVAPIIEELACRAMIQNALTRWVPWVLAVVLQALAFGFAHAYGTMYAVVTSCLGLAFGFVYRWRRSLVAPIAMHALQNLFVVVVALTITDRRYPMLGVHADAEDDGRCRIEQLVAGSPAEAVGLRVGDEIRAVSGAAVTDSAELSAAVQEFAPGTSVVVAYSREGEDHEVTAVLDARPE